MAGTTGAGRKGTVKLNELLRIERAMQEKWESEKVFEMDAPEAGSEEDKYVVLLYILINIYEL